MASESQTQIIGAQIQDADHCTTTTAPFIIEVNSSLFSEILKILNFLEIPVNPDRLSCTLDNLEGDYHRKADPQKRPFPFNNQQVKIKSLELDTKLLARTTAVLCIAQWKAY